MASFSVPCPKSSAFASSGLRQQQFMVCFSTAANARFQGSKHNQTNVLKAQSQVNEIAVEKSSNSTLVSSTNYEALPSVAKDIEPTKEPGPHDASISAFLSEVASLVKLVDSRDIMELQLKQQDYELTIRKREALPPPVTAAPVVMMQPPPAPTMLPSQLPPVQTAAMLGTSAPASSAPALPAPAKSSKSSHPPLKCPMAGIFYRCPAPGEPPFVKVGDKVQKGQVLCIIEAMKLMNEIEADQSGTIVEILAEDGKPVSVDMPLFVIEP